MNEELNSDAQIEIAPKPVTAAAPPPPKPQRPIRLWPALIILALLAAAVATAYFLIGDDLPMFSMAIFMGMPLTGLLLILWLLLGSRLPWKRRFCYLGLLFLGSAAIVFAAETGMRVLVISYAITLLLAFSVLWLTATRAGSSLLQRSGICVFAIVLAALSLALRFDGMWGSLFPNLAWRWTITDEDRAEAYRRSRSKKVPQQIATEALTPSLSYWPGFRGPNRDSVVTGEKTRTDWYENPPKLIWKHPVGLGWSSFAVVGGYLFTQEQRREKEAVVCYRADDGAEVWAYTVNERFSEEAGGDGPRATPTFSEGRIYALGATGVLCCLDAGTGKDFWKVNILKENGVENIPWGMAGSPLVYEDIVVVNPGGKKDNCLVAYDRMTGKRVWSGGNDVATYSSPQLAKLHGVEQILIFNTDALAGHDPKTGKVLWTFPWPTKMSNNTVQPRILDDSTVLVSSMFVGAARIKITHDDGKKWKATKEWISPRMRLYYNDLVTKDGYAYGLESGVLVCLDVKSDKPKRMWKDGRYGSGQILLVDDLLLIQGEQGDVILVKASPDSLQEVARFQAIEGKTWNHPVLVNGRLYVRNSAEMACYDIAANP